MTPEFLSAVVDTLLPGDAATPPLPSGTEVGIAEKLAEHLVAGRDRARCEVVLRAIATTLRASISKNAAAYMPATSPHTPQPRAQAAHATPPKDKALTGARTARRWNAMFFCSKAYGTAPARRPRDRTVR